MRFASGTSDVLSKGLEDAKRLLGQNLEEEKKTDEALSELAEAVINLEAADQTEQ